MKIAHISGAFNGRLLVTCGITALSQVTLGLEQAAFTSTQEMPAFAHTFGVYSAEGHAHRLGSDFMDLLNGLPYVGLVFGLVQGSLISRRFGRRASLFVMCLWAFFGVSLLVTSHSQLQILFGRMITYVSVGIELAVVPVLHAELVPAQVRGLVVGTYHTGLLVGQLVMSLICRATREIEGDSSWRVPLGLLYVIPGLVFCLGWLIPESPRLLLINARPEKARQSLQKLRQGRFTDDEIEQEFQQLCDTIDITTDQGSFREIFRGSHMQRTLIIVGVNIFMQVTGDSFVSQYGTAFVRTIDTVNPFSMVCIYSAINIFVSLVAMLLSDTVGRVPLMFASAIIQAGSLFTLGGLGTTSTSPAVSSATMAMMAVFGVGYQIGWGPLSHVVAAEVPTTRLRDVTYAVGAIFSILIQCAISLSVPRAVDGQMGPGSQVGFLFGIFAICAALFTWFCVPECKGKTLEEMDHLFLHGMPIREFARVGQVNVHVSKEVEKDGV
ncbi:general substrate transporter [Aspergillus campestris IBT 28561]|uniref:General substrate transporter n=1 Tax=Aspergillus campestris (strain IBT 28561) TaxID=1392248 RepID=A0A2I1D1P3_ASPC2|nr:general substrate transporter [Aspergillus campestris IBT 28561]PKY03801.1 general substrate transporter [Aspergillus campestris IBT 28561]